MICAGEVTLTVCHKSHNPDRQGSILGNRRRQAIKRKQKVYTYPVLAIILLVHHVWGMSTVIQSTPITARSVPQPLPDTGNIHSQPAILFQAAEKFLVEVAHQSVFLPQETASAFVVVRSAIFSSSYGLGAAADTVCCSKATLLCHHKYRPKNWLSEEPVSKPLTASKLIFGLHTTTVIAMMALLAAGMLISYASPETDGLFH